MTRARCSVMRTTIHAETAEFSEMLDAAQPRVERAALAPVAPGFSAVSASSAFHVVRLSDTDAERTRR